MNNDSFYIVLTGYKQTVSALSVLLDKPLELTGEWTVSISDFSYSGTKSKLVFAPNMKDALADPELSYIGFSNFGGINITKGEEPPVLLGKGFRRSSNDGKYFYHPQIAGVPETTSGDPRLRTFKAEDTVTTIKCPSGYYRNKKHLIATMSAVMPSELRSSCPIKIDVREDLDDVTFRYEQLQAASRECPGRFDGNQVFFIGPVVRFLGLENNIYRKENGVGGILEHYFDLDAMMAVPEPNGWFSNRPPTSDGVPSFRSSTVVTDSDMKPTIRFFPAFRRINVRGNDNSRTMQNYALTSRLHEKEVYLGSHHGANKCDFHQVIFDTFYPVKKNNQRYDSRWVFLPNATGKKKFWSGLNNFSFPFVNIFDHLHKSYLVSFPAVTGVTTISKTFELGPYDESPPITLVGADNTTTYPPKTVDKFATLLEVPPNVDVSIVNKHTIVNPSNIMDDSLQRYYGVKGGKTTPVVIGQRLNIPVGALHGNLAFLHCDLAGRSYLNNKQVNVLDIFVINQDESSSTSVESTYSKRTHPLLNSSFQKINVDVLDKEGKPFQFFPESEVYLTLHFSKVGDVPTQGI